MKPTIIPVQLIHLTLVVSLSLWLSSCQSGFGLSSLGIHTPMWLKPVVKWFRPAPTTPPLAPPRPLKPEKKHPSVPLYTTLLSLKSTSLQQIERVQVYLNVPAQVPITQYKYICKDILQKHKHDTDVIWIYFLQGKQAQQSVNQLAENGTWQGRAEWFSSKVPHYLKFHIAKAHEIFYGFHIEYRYPPRSIR